MNTKKILKLILIFLISCLVTFASIAPIQMARAQATPDGDPLCQRIRTIVRAGLNNRPAFASMRDGAPEAEDGVVTYKSFGYLVTPSDECTIFEKNGEPTMICSIAIGGTNLSQVNRAHEKLVKLTEACLGDDWLHAPDMKETQAWATSVDHFTHLEARIGVTIEKRVSKKDNTARLAVFFMPGL